MLNYTLLVLFVFIFLKPGIEKIEIHLLKGKKGKEKLI